MCSIEDLPLLSGGSLTASPNDALLRERWKGREIISGKNYARPVRTAKPLESVPAPWERASGCGFGTPDGVAPRCALASPEQPDHLVLKTQ